MRTTTARTASLAAFLLLAVPLSPTAAGPPQTPAEKSNFQATSRYAEVIEFCEQLARESPVVRLGTLGTSFEGRKLPLLILADPPVTTPEEAARSKKLVVFAMGNIHAGEVDGKEALLMLARDIATPHPPPLSPREGRGVGGEGWPLLKDLVLVFAPIFNPDGNERLGKNRPTQAGPPLVGTRTNAQDLDLNRDFVKLESPEVRALVRFLNKWDPAVFIDLHTTNGSRHRYTLTYEGGRCPAGDPRLIAFTRDELLPEAGRRMEKAVGYKSYFYGNFSADRRRWETVSPLPRYGWHYVGLRNRIAILAESYSYAPFKDRVLASKAFVQSICEYTAANKDKVGKLLAEAREATVRAGRAPGEKDLIVLRHQAVPLGRPVRVLGFVEEVRDGRRIATDKPHEYEVEYLGGTEPVLSVRRPYAYLFPARLGRVVENLQRHGIEVEELREDIELDVEVYRIDRITRAAVFQKHHPVTLEATARPASRRLEAGTILVRTAQPLGSLATYLLEPQSADGLATWNFFDEVLQEGQDFPVLRLPAAVPLTAGRVRPLAEDRVMNKPITFETVYAAGRPLSFSGAPVSGLVWLEDGEHFLQVKEGRLRKVHALTGRSEPFYDPEKLARGLASLPTIGRSAAQSLARSPQLRLNPQRTGALFLHADDLYYCNLDGTGAVRLTRTPGNKELVSFSPDGKFVAFVRDNNLHVVDLATQTERALTTDGSELILNGKADWVYFEEVFNRRRQAYWWSPDSSRIAFLRFDDTPVHKFTLVDPVSPRPAVEATPYPKAGAPNPLVKLGIVTVAGGTPAWADLRDYSETATLLVRAGWTPDSQRVYFYVQDRAQTWLDVCLVARDGGEPTRLFRETTKAWVDDPGAPTFLKDGSFLLPSERTGWRHLYHFDKDGRFKGPITSGPWEARTLHLVDEEGGWVYFSGTRDSHLAVNLYRVRLDGSALERLTSLPGDHRVSVGPKGKFFIDSWSNHQTPVQVRLYHADGSPARTLDTNPVYVLEEYRRGQYELVQIPTADGFVLEGSLLRPPDFDPGRRYPVWFMTYGGPHAPTIQDSWGGGRVRDEMLAQMGFVVFRCDPRSASGKGACSTWTAYRQLGVQELKDIETALRWLTTHSYIDPTRIGMSGHSYGGFLTAYALTHSKLFAAGIASAPVTDWRNYDSIYTERYMNTPQENPEGYNVTSVVRAARDLHGKLLIIHGLMDDNVHAQNSLQLIDALQRADKDFEVMVYPRARHGLLGRHYQRLMIDFMKRTLKPEP
ncbi:MAG TPA: DPP IV N-terminal domain-containing protein [Gemmataceae bacterium]|nr:DPP IV N-terminal domain-containing protein [Gemmataceae bacterium]